MGDIADSIIEGEVCELCLMPLDEVAGIPTTCAECKPPRRKRKRNKTQNL